MEMGNLKMMKKCSTVSTPAYYPRAAALKKISSTAYGQRFIVNALCIFMAAFMGFVFLCGRHATEEQIVLIVTVKCKKLRQPLDYILVNISAAGLVFCLFSISTVFLFSTQGYFVFGPTVCALESLFGSMAGLVTGWSLAFLAAERYIVICKPFGNFGFGSIHALFEFGFTWVLGLGVALPPFFGWSRATYVADDNIYFVMDAVDNWKKKNYRGTA